MDELQVLVRQTPGVITWNFEDLKIALREEMEKYKSLVYTDESIPAAKNDVAQLRKLKTMVEDRRKEIKNRCLEPYAIIEEQAKELTALIDKPIDLIDRQVKDYEKKQKEKRKAKIDAYMNDKFCDLPGEIALKAKMKIYDVRWLNATYKVKDWQSIVDDCAEEVNRCLDILNGTEQEFREEAFNAYSQNLDLSVAVARVQELQAQKERILAAERRRREEEERRAREDEERRAAKAVRTKLVKNEAIEQATVADVIDNIEQQAFAYTQIQPEEAVSISADDEMIIAHEAIAEQRPDDGSICLRIFGTTKEQQKIFDYIGFLGVKFERI